MAGPAGIEPVTDGLRVRCSALLSYGPICFKKENRLRNIGLTVVGIEEFYGFGLFQYVWFIVNAFL